MYLKNIIMNIYLKRVDLILCLVDLLKSEGESENMKGK